MARNTLIARDSAHRPGLGRCIPVLRRARLEITSFEKIISFQTQYVRMYAAGYRVWEMPPSSKLHRVSTAM